MAAKKKVVNAVRKYMTEHQGVDLFGLAPHSVSSYITADEESKIFSRWPSICHSGLRHIRIYSKTHKPLVLGDQLNLSAKERKDKGKVKYLQWLMDHSVFKDAFVDHDAGKAMEEGFVIRDLSAIPANLCMYAITATRYLWESGSNHMVDAWNAGVDAGISPELAFIASHYLIREPANTNHTCIDPNRTCIDTVDNFVKKRPVNVSKGTIADFVDYRENGGIHRAFGELSYGYSFLPESPRQTFQDLLRKGDIKTYKIGDKTFPTIEKIYQEAVNG